MADNQSVKDTPEELRQNDSNTNEKEQKEPKQKSIKLIIKRQDNQDSKPYEETFEIPYKENMNVIACLMEIRRNPVNNKGENNTRYMGYELFRRSLWCLFNGYQWTC